MRFSNIEDFQKNGASLLAKNISEASARYSAYSKKDPYPHIPAALLNSADIYRYVKKTGMIHPFYPKELRSATYPVRIGGSCIYWDDKGVKQHIILTDDNSFELGRNSIVFVELEPEFRVPDYIALRFNLKIKHIYKGLLLGTGPIVDPGFQGKLFIPLHNLTNNIYEFRKGEGLIFMEFTKLSPHHSWGGDDKGNIPYISFPSGKFMRESGKYIEDALTGYISAKDPGGVSKISVNNAVPAELSEFSNKLAINQEAISSSGNQTKQTLSEYKTSIDKFERKLEDLQKLGIWGGIGAVIAIVAAIATLAFTTKSIVETSNARVDTLIQSVSELEVIKEEVYALQYQLEEGEIQITNDELVSLIDRIEDLETQIAQTPQD